jgi:hypothetical protein
MIETFVRKNTHALVWADMIPESFHEFIMDFWIEDAKSYDSFVDFIQDLQNQPMSWQAQRVFNGLHVWGLSNGEIPLDHYLFRLNEYYKTKEKKEQVCPLCKK